MQQLAGNALRFISVELPTCSVKRRLLSPGKVVLEILETVQPTQEVVDACRALAYQFIAWNAFPKSANANSSIANSPDKKRGRNSPPALLAIARSSCAFYPAFSPSIAAMYSSTRSLQPSMCIQPFP